MYEQVIKRSPLDDIVPNMQGLECYFHPITTLHQVNKMIHYGSIAWASYSWRPVRTYTQQAVSWTLLQLYYYFALQKWFIVWECSVSSKM